MILVESALSILLAQQDISQQGVRRSGVRHSRHGFAGLGIRFLPAGQEPVGLRKFIMARRGIGLQFEATEQNRFGLGIRLGFVENSAQRQVRVRSSVIELSGPLQRLFRFLPIFLLDVSGTQQSVSLRKCLVEFNRLAKMRNTLVRFVLLYGSLALFELRVGIFLHRKISI